MGACPAHRDSDHCSLSKDRRTVWCRIRPVASAIESLFRAAANPPVRRRRSFHHRYRKLRLAAQILLGAAMAVGGFAISHFTYNATGAANCYTVTTDDSGNAPQVAMKGPECYGVLASAYDYMRLDASIAVLGVVLVLSSALCYRKARRFRPRAPIRPAREH